MGFGQSGGEKAATANLNNIFGYGMDTSKKSEATGTSTLGDAASYFKGLLTAGRQKTAQNAAPAVNAQVSQSDAVRREEASRGSGRSGGTVAADREASSTGMKNVDDIINQNMVKGKQAGAEGLTGIGESQLSHALALLGLGKDTQSTLYSGAVNKEGQQGAEFASIISSLI